MGEPKHAGGRPTKFNLRRLREAKTLYRLGATDRDVADYFGVSHQTIATWKLQHPQFLDAQKEKDKADGEVVRSLYERARGYSHPDVVITNYKGEITITNIVKHYPPDTTACIFWLKNRQRDRWRDRTELTGANGSALLQIPSEIIAAAAAIARGVQIPSDRS